MKYLLIFLCSFLLAVPPALAAQSSRMSETSAEPPSGTLTAESSSSLQNPTAFQSAAPVVATAGADVQRAGLGGPLSRVAMGVGISPLGITLTAATNLNRYMNLRGTGNVFSYSINSFNTNGFNVTPKLDLASAGASLDFFPFPNHGFRVSPGVLFYNQNGATASFDVTGGTSFTLNDYTYYASSTNPVRGSGTLGLHSNSPAFTATTGWGNVIPRSGGHWSFPFEIGAAFIGAPAVNIALTSGQVCDANGLNCVNVATDPNVQANLQAQIVKYRKDLDPLKTYPIVSFGVAYNFSVRHSTR